MFTEASEVQTQAISRFMTEAVESGLVTKHNADPASPSDEFSAALALFFEARTNTESTVYARLQHEMGRKDALNKFLRAEIPDVVRTLALPTTRLGNRRLSPDKTFLVYFHAIEAGARCILAGLPLAAIAFNSEGFTSSVFVPTGMSPQESFIRIHDLAREGFPQTSNPRK